MSPLCRQSCSSASPPPYRCPTILLIVLFLGEKFHGLLLQIQQEILKLSDDIGTNDLGSFCGKTELLAKLPSSYRDLFEAEQEVVARAKS